MEKILLPEQYLCNIFLDNECRPKVIPRRKRVITVCHKERSNKGCSHVHLLNWSCDVLNQDYMHHTPKLPMGKFNAINYIIQPLDPTAKLKIANIKSHHWDCTISYQQKNLGFRFRVQDCGFRIYRQGLRFIVLGLEFMGRVQDLAFRVSNLWVGFSVQGLHFMGRVQGLAFRVYNLWVGFRVSVEGLEFLGKVQCLVFKIYGQSLGFRVRVQHCGFRIYRQGLGFSVRGLEFMGTV